MPSDTIIPVSPDSLFPAEHLPFSAFRLKNGTQRMCSAIGEFVIDLCELEKQGLFRQVQSGKEVFETGYLNTFMALAAETRNEYIRLLQKWIKGECEDRFTEKSFLSSVLIPMNAVELVLAVQIGDFTDFYSSEHHARKVGTLFRGAEHALNPNWHHLPVAYHGRAGSIIPSGVPIRRPKGQVYDVALQRPVFRPSQRLDFELEMGFFIGAASEFGLPISVNNAARHIFGFSLLNDWSARDIQQWEYQPLGPFLGKNFATSISPWIVRKEALEGAKIPMKPQDPEPLPYLHYLERTTYDISLEVRLLTPDMPEPAVICATNFRELHWSAEQQIAHHTINGCNLRTGDLLASGTISGAGKGESGCLLEATENGKIAVQLPGNEERFFLQDGDVVEMRAFAQCGAHRIGFGEVKTRVLPPI